VTFMLYGTVLSLHTKDTTEMELFCWPAYSTASCISYWPSQQKLIMFQR